MSRKFVGDRLNVELRDYAPGFHWAEEFASILRSCDHLELKIRKVNGSSEPEAVADGPWRADLQVMAGDWDKKFMQFPMQNAVLTVCPCLSKPLSNYPN